MYSLRYSNYPSSLGNRVYAVNLLRLNYFFSDLNDLDLSDWTPYLFTDFSQYVLNVHAYPINVGGFIDSENEQNIFIGGRQLPTANGKLFDEESLVDIYTSDVMTKIPLLNDSDVKWMSFDPYVKAEIYLPYCGYQPLDVNAIMDKYVSVQYCIDYMTGMCSVYVWSYDDVIQSNGRIVYQTDFKIAVDVPYSFDSAGINERQSALAAIKGSINAITGGVVGAGAGSNGGIGGAIAGGIVGTVKGGASGLEDWYKAAAPYLQSGGTASGSWTHTVEDFTPHIILAYKQPVDYSVDTFKKYRGTKVFKPVEDLTDCYGYTQVFDVHLEGFGTATADELDSIRNLLASGIILPESEPTPEPEPEYTITICDLDGTVLTSYSPALDVESVSLAIGGPGWPSLTLNFVDNTTHLLPFYPSNIDLSSTQPFQGLALIPGGISTDVVIPWGAEDLAYTIDSDVTFYVVSR